MEGAEWQGPTEGWARPCEDTEGCRGSACWEVSSSPPMEATWELLGVAQGGPTLPSPVLGVPLQERKEGLQGPL